MKRLFLLLLAAFALFTMSAQKYYVCTGENVYLRTGPGKNYKPYYFFAYEKVFIYLSACFDCNHDFCGCAC